MRKIHYRNIGFPKTGTTWLYHQLISHPEVDGKVDLLHKEFLGFNKEQYVDKYKKYDVSFNLYTNLFSDTDRIYTFTHLTFSLRNLYDLVNSWYNFLKFKQNVNIPTSYIDPRFVDDIEKTFKFWSNYEVKFLFYDDLLANNKEYFYSICDYIGLKRYFDTRYDRVLFPTKIVENIIFDDKSVKKINDAITIIEDYTKRNLTHWKK